MMDELLIDTEDITIDCRLANSRWIKVNDWTYRCSKCGWNIVFSKYGITSSSCIPFTLPEQCPHCLSTMEKLRRNG